MTDNVLLSFLMRAMAPDRVLFPAEQIAHRVAELGQAIRRDYEGRPFTIVAILRGAVVFASDLLKHVGAGATVELLEASSYGSGTTSSGRVTLQRYGSLDVARRDVLLVDDIVDSGHTLRAVRDAVEEMGARSVRTCVLLDKPSRRQVEVHVDYCGFVIDDVFVFGYGLDRDGRCRCLPYIACAEEASGRMPT